ncbi:hypothetical protein [Ornithinibacillus sp. 179-J 7C1 HS]|uniref:hypothetical protein n=1 Tax=Ornithinibacillus sp. 179-J 7C1 HS TaxID=3142384 RepID=UPI0039A0799A
MNKKVWLISALLMMSIILIGCSSESDEASENDISENESPTDQPEQTEATSFKVITPPDLYLVYDGRIDAAGKVDQWCWEKSGEPCNITPNPPNEVLQGFKALSIKQGEPFKLSWTSNDSSPDGRIFSFDSIEVEQIRMGEEKMIEVKNNQIIAPTESGRYFYSVTLKWTDSLKGEAHYAFSLAVHQ